MGGFPWPLESHGPPYTPSFYSRGFSRCLRFISGSSLCCCVSASLSAAGPYTGFMHEPSPGVNNWTMPHALPAAVQAGGMGGANDPSAVPARTGPSQEGWAKSEFGANSWPSFESISPQLPKDQWSMGGSAAKQRNWNVSNIISGFFGLEAAEGMHETGEAAFKRQLYQSLISQTLYLKTMILSLSCAHHRASRFSRCSTSRPLWAC